MPGKAEGTNGNHNERDEGALAWTDGSVEFSYH
jgi:hypothetical protein